MFSTRWAHRWQRRLERSTLLDLNTCLKAVENELSRNKSKTSKQAEKEKCPT